MQIALLGDSTTAAEVPRRVAPAEPQLEDVVRELLAAEPGLPPVQVLNLGLGGESIRRLLDSGRYQRQVAPLPGLDYVLIRYGLIDRTGAEPFAARFARDFGELVAKLRADHPAATLIAQTVIPYLDAPTTAAINAAIREAAAREGLALLDLHRRYAEELRHGPNMLSYRRIPLARIPERMHALVRPYVQAGPEPWMVVLDNRLDAHFAQLPGWFADRHPNLAGYHVIADETARFLAPLLRARALRDAVR